MAHPSDAHLIEALVAARDAGDEDALNAAAWALVEHHGGWLVSIRNRYMRKSSWPETAREDYLQELRLDAFTSILRYDPAAGAKVPRWIAINVHGASGAVSDQVHPLGLRRGAHTYAAATGKGITGLSTISTDAPVRADSHTMVGDLLPAEELDPLTNLTRAAQRPVLLELLEQCGLSDLQHEAITRLLGLDGEEPESDHEIARRLGMTRQGVNYSFLRGIARLQHPTALRQIVRARL